MKKIIFILSLFSFITTAQQSMEFAGNISSITNSNGVIELTLTNGLFNIYMIDDNIIRFRFTNKDKFDPSPSYAVVETRQLKDYQYKEFDDRVEITTTELKVSVSKSPCRVSVYDNNGDLINKDSDSFGMYFDGNEVRCFKEYIEGERFYGLGEKTGPLDKTGREMTLWNTDYPAYTDRKDELYVSIPFFIGMHNKKAYGIFLDNTYKSRFNFYASNNRFYWFGAEGGELDYYFIYGPETKKVIIDYTSITGRMQLPPKWALGYQQCKWSYFPQSEVMRLAETFRAKEIPCDVIYLDIHYMDGYRVFTWDNDRFPEPEKMLRDLETMGFKVVPIIDPGVKADENYKVAVEGLEKDVFVKYPDGVIYQGEVWPSWAYFTDYTNPEGREFWGKYLGELLEQGIDGFWNDMNEPSVWGQAFPDIVLFNDNGYTATHKKIHNVYGLQMGKATREAIEKYSPDTRRFVLTRAGFAGIQRYTAVWTGDNYANEEHLKLACLMPQNLGLSGVPFTGSDVGGFMGEPSKRLYVRWMQLGALTPFFRGHSAINKKDQEPWAFGYEVEDMVREAIKLRYRLMPHLYNLFYQSSKTGLPIIQPMMLYDQYDDNCYTWDAQQQFMLGEDLLAAPVLSETDNFRKLYLPSGNWIDLNTHAEYEGGKWITIEAPLNVLPLFIKAGGIIPMKSPENYVGESGSDDIELLIHPGKNNSYLLYEDDGITNDHKKGKYSLTEIKLTSGKEIKLNVNVIDGNYQPERKHFTFKMLLQESDWEISYNNNKIIKARDNKSFSEPGSGYYYDKQKEALFIKVEYSREMEIILQK